MATVALGVAWSSCALFPGVNTAGFLFELQQHRLEGGNAHVTFDGADAAAWPQ